MAKFCGKCGMKLDEQTRKCPNCDKLTISETQQPDNSVDTNNQSPAKTNTDVTTNKELSKKESKTAKKTEKKAKKKTRTFLCIVAILLCLSILASGVSVVLVYFNIVDMPFIYNIMDMIGISDDEVSYVGQSSESCYKPNEDNIIYENEEKSFGYVNNIILVFFSNKATETQITEVVSSMSGEVVGKIDGINQYQIQVEATTKENLEKICEELLKFDAVKNATIDYVVTTTTNETPNDPWKDTFQGGLGVDWNENEPSGTNWWFEATKISSAWEYSDYFSNIKVGVVDNGFDTKHEDLNITVLNNDVNNYENHGTHVAGVIGATVNNNKGISGILKDVSLYGVDCYSTSKQKKKNITVSSLYEGINLCIQNDCKVINMSSGTEYTDKEETKKVSYEMAKYAANCIVYLLDSYDKDFLVVQSAGNGDDWDNGVNAKDYNGWFSAIDEAVVQELFDEYKEKGVKTEHQITVQDVMDSFMVVAAVDEKQKKGEYQLSSFSNYGDTVTVCAPGVNVFSTIKSGGLDGSYGYMDGTSMAAPIVSGITALVWSVDQEMSSGEVKQIITETATQKVLSRRKKDNGTYFMINAKAAIEKAVEKKTTRLLNGYWENFIQCYKVYKFLEDGTVNEYDAEPGVDPVPENLFLSRTLHYKCDGKTLIIESGDGFKKSLELVTKASSIKWDIGLSNQISEIPDDEEFFYETGWKNNGAPSDNAMYLVKSKPRTSASNNLINDALIAYQNHISNIRNSWNSYSYYMLHDMDGNGVPELIIRSGTCEADFMFEFFSYNNGIVSCGTTGAGHSSLAAPDDGTGLLVCWQHMGYESRYLITLKDYKINRTVLFEGRKPDESEKFDFLIEYETSDTSPLNVDNENGNQILKLTELLSNGEWHSKQNSIPTIVFSFNTVYEDTYYAYIGLYDEEGNPLYSDGSKITINTDGLDARYHVPPDELVGCVLNQEKTLTISDSDGSKKAFLWDENSFSNKKGWCLTSDDCLIIEGIELHRQPS